MKTQLPLSPDNGQNEVSKQKHTFSLILGSGALWTAAWSLLLILPHFEGTFKSPFWFFGAAGQLQSDVTSWILGVRRKKLDYTSRAGWPRRHFCVWIIPVMCNYHALRYLKWRGHHLRADRDPVRSNRVRKRALWTPFWTAKMALSTRKREILDAKRGPKWCERTPDAGQTHMDFWRFLHKSPFGAKIDGRK